MDNIARGAPALHTATPQSTNHTTMSVRSIQTRSRLCWLVALGLSTALTGCGGGGNAGTAVTADPGVDGQQSPSAGEPDAPPTPTAVVQYTVLARNAGDIAVIALQDGDGAWQRVEADSTVTDPAGFVTASYRLPLTTVDGRFGAMVVCDAGDRFRGDLIQARADVVTKRTVSCITDSPALAGTVTNTDAGGATVYLGEASASPPAGMADYAIAAPSIPGRHTLIARDDGVQTLFYVDRNVDIGANTTVLPLIDFAYALPADTARYTLAVYGLPHPDFDCDLHPELRVGSTFADLAQGAQRHPIAGEMEIDWQPISQTQRENADRFRLRADCGHTGDPADRTDERGVVDYRLTPAGTRVELPDALATPTIGMVDQRLQLTIRPYGPLRVGLSTRAYHFHLDDRVDERGIWDIRIDQSWLADGSEFTFPDVSALAGWEDRYYPIARDQSYLYGTDHVSHLTAYASEGANIWNLIEGFNNGLMPTTEGTVYWARKVLR